MKVIALALLALLGATAAVAQTTVAEPWVRATVAQQSGTGLFVQLTSAKGGRLVAASSPVAGVAELHEMSMQGDVMRMRALPAGLELPAGKTVTLKPGGFHVMLMDLRQQLKPGDTVAVTLVIEGADKQRELLQIKAQVRALGAAAPEHKH